MKRTYRFFLVGFGLGATRVASFDVVNYVGKRSSVCTCRACVAEMSNVLLLTSKSRRERRVRRRIRRRYGFWFVRLKQTTGQYGSCTRKLVKERDDYPFSF